MGANKRRAAARAVHALALAGLGAGGRDLILAHKFVAQSRGGLLRLKHLAAAHAEGACALAAGSAGGGSLGLVYDLVAKGLGDLAAGENQTAAAAVPPGGAAGMGAVRGLRGVVDHVVAQSSGGAMLHRFAVVAAADLLARQGAGWGGLGLPGAEAVGLADVGKLRLRGIARGAERAGEEGQRALVVRVAAEEAAVGLELQETGAIAGRLDPEIAVFVADPPPGVGVVLPVGDRGQRIGVGGQGQIRLAVPKLDGVQAACSLGKGEDVVRLDRVQNAALAGHAGGGHGHCGARAADRGAGIGTGGVQDVLAVIGEHVLPCPI